MDDEDADFERAIALSLQDATQKPPGADLRDVDDESEDEDFKEQLRLALEASKAEASSSRSNTRSQTNIPLLEPPSNGYTGSRFLSQRAQLEKERVERQKRLRKEAGLDDSSDEGSMSAQPPPAKRQHLSSNVHNNGQANSISSSSRSATNVPVAEQAFWHGEMRQTAVKPANPRKDGRLTFRLTEVLGKKSDISFAILSSYSLMLSWIYEFFERGTPVIMVAQPDASGQEGIRNVLPNWIKTTPRLRGGNGCMHMKFMLLFYKTGRLRVVVSTANLVDFDYRDIENTVWLQDVPLRSSPIPHDPKVVDDFPSVMQRVLQSVNVSPALKTLLQTDHPDLPIKTIEDLRIRWDWSKVKAHLVPSIAGKHEGWPNVILTGHPRLMKVVRNIGMRTGKGMAAKELILECQGSSIGQYSTQWMNEFHWSARGESAEDWLDEPKSRRAKLPWPPVRVVFPSLKTVQESVLGERGGGTIFCRKRQWQADKFPRQLFYDSKSKAGGVLMHSKMIIASFREKPKAGKNIASKGKGRDVHDSASDTEDDDDDGVIEVLEPAIGWAYVGSHNFTPSAWGTLSGSGFNPVLSITNYELGIVFPLKDEKELQNVACWERPARKYVLEQDKPWMQEESVHHQQGS